MSRNTNIRLNKLFYYFLMVTFLIYIIPLEYQLEPSYMYGLNYLGWFSIIIIFISLLFYLFLLFLDIKYRNFKRLIIRTFVLVLIVFISIQFRNYYAATIPVEDFYGKFD